MKNKTSGFTLVELMVVVLLVGLAVLVFTQIPLFTLSSWRKGTERLKMQRDANYAMIRIQRKLRPAIDAEVPNLYTLDIYTRDIDQNTVKSSFFLREKQLYYRDPEETEEPVIGADAPFDVTSFDVTSSSDGTINIVLTLKMKRENVKTTLTTAVKPRN